MKKVIDIIKKSLYFSTITLGAIYLYWFYSFPIHEPFYFAPFLFAILLVITVISKLPSNNRKLFSFFLFFALLALSANIFYFVTYYPRTIDTANFRNAKYSIASTRDLDSHSFMLFYKCNKWGVNCTSLYVSYSWERTLHIFIDQANNEVSILHGEPLSRFVYTDGQNPREYEGNSEQMGNHIYQMSVDNILGNCGYPTCDLHVYTLYECKQDYTSCNPLPVQYTASYEVAPVLDANEAAHEINVYDSDHTLIFIYGEHPRCYVEGCEIVKK